MCQQPRLYRLRRFAPEKWTFPLPSFRIWRPLLAVKQYWEGNSNLNGSLISPQASAARCLAWHVGVLTDEHTPLVEGYIRCGPVHMRWFVRDHRAGSGGSNQHEDLFEFGILMRCQLLSALSVFPFFNIFSHCIVRRSYCQTRK